MLSFEAFCAHVEEIVPVPRPDADLALVDDLGVDSLQAIELLVRCEELAGPHATLDDAAPVRTLGDLYAAYRRLVGAEPDGQLNRDRAGGRCR